MQLVKSGCTASRGKNGQRFYKVTETEDYIIESKNYKETAKFKISSFHDLRFEGHTTVILVTKNNDNLSLKFNDPINFDAWVAFLTYFLFEKNQISLSMTEFENVTEKVKAGDPFFFYASTKDTMGKSLESGSHEWDVFFKSSKRVILADIVDFEDGSYRFGGLIQQSGSYQIMITTNNQTVIKELLVDPLGYDHYEIDAPKTIAGEKFNICITLLDKFNNLIKADLIRSEFEWKETDRGYVSEFCFEKAGFQEILVELAGKIHIIPLKVRSNVFSKFDIKIPERIMSLETFQLTFTPTDQHGNVTISPNDVYVSVGGCFYDFDESIELHLEFSGKYELKVYIGENVIYEDELICLADETEKDRLKKLEMEKEEKELNDLSSQVDLELAKWTRGIGFIRLLNEIVSRFFDQDIQQVYLLTQDCKASDITRTYRKSLFKTHPDHFQDQDYKTKLEKTKLFGILQNAHDRYQLYKY